MEITCLPASWHNHPEKITPGIQRKIQAAKASNRFDLIYVLYGDCGTGGQLDEMLREEKIERIPGAHCYEFFAGHLNFEKLAEEEPGTFFLTDYLTRHFDRLIIRGLGLDRHPELRDAYFGNYRRLVYLAQTQDERLRLKAEHGARRLGLDFVYRFHGYGEMQRFLEAKEWHN